MQAKGSLSDLQGTLAESGLGGLWRSCSLKSIDDINRDCFEFTKKVIEVRYSSAIDCLQ